MFNNLSFSSLEFDDDFLSRTPISYLTISKLEFLIKRKDLESFEDLNNIFERYIYYFNNLIIEYEKQNKLNYIKESEYLTTLIKIFLIKYPSNLFRFKWWKIITVKDMISFYKRNK